MFERAVSWKIECDTLTDADLETLSPSAPFTESLEAEPASQSSCVPIAPSVTYLPPDGVWRPSELSFSPAERAPHSSNMNVLDSLTRRINWYPNMWAKVGSRWDKNRLPPLEDRMLVKRICVGACPNPPGEDFVVTDGGAWVPQSECRKAGRGFNFPRCVFGRGETAESFADLAARASSLISEIIKP